MNARLKELPAWPQPSTYDAERKEELRHKYAAEPEPNLEWQDIAAQDAGIPRSGEI